MTVDIVNIPNRDVSLLYPAFARLVKLALDDANAAGYYLSVFEGYRTPERQDWLYASGRTRPGTLITRAKAWESPHQAALAVDVALHVDGKWSWKFTSQVHPFFHKHGLETLDFEVAHVQMTGGLGGKVVGAFARDLGLARTWIEVEHAVRQRNLSAV